MARSHGEGTIVQRQDGRWQASLMVEGKRRTVYGATKAEANRKLAELKRQASNGTLPDPGKRTVADLLTLWLETSAPNWKPRTLSDNRATCERYLLPALGTVRLSRLEPAHVQRLLAPYQSQGKARTALRVYDTLRQACALAVRWGWLPENPCDRAQRPQYRPERRGLWTPEELARFLRAAASHWTGPLWLVALCSGCRPGELLALGWEAVDLEAGTISVTRTLHRIGGEWVYSAPKTRSGARTLSLPPEGTAALRRQRAQQAEWRLRAGPAWPDTGLVFTSQVGNPLHTTAVSHYLRERCERAGVPPLTMHQLRHLHASLLLSQGLPLPEVSRRLGHAHSGITAQVYSHALAGDDTAATRAIERALSGSR